ncbi:MAG: ATP-dependent DNA helicase RecG, partial [Spirochaetales bacterium]|nr:ATP-dependent DNA helicase RecG [Spirochaetales bacterium]
MFLAENKEDIQYLKGIGPRLKEIYAKLGIKNIADLVQHFPRDYVDRSRVDKLKDALKKESINVIVKVIAQDYIGWGKKRSLKIMVQDESASAALLCFGRNFLAANFSPGKHFLITGQFKYRYSELQCSAFSYEALEEENADFDQIIPLYPLTAGLKQNQLRQSIKKALEKVKDHCHDQLPAHLAIKYNFPGRFEAIRNLHFPDNPEALEKAREFLKFEEFFYFLLYLNRRNQKDEIQRGKTRKIPFALKTRLLERLPFKLTPAQKQALLEIELDILGRIPMARLLQGDVGSGKTIVAFLAALSVIEAGEQAVIMAPTEILARQQAEKAAQLLEPLGISIAFFSGSTTGEPRKYLLEALKQGEIDLIIGTHSLFSDDVAYKNLGLVVVDEQHRFGVLQRLSLVQKGRDADLLLMTATPIPRTLALSVLGDLKISEIRHLPEGRKEIITHLTRHGNEEKVYQRVRQELLLGHQAYFVYPLIEESDKVDLKNAEAMYDLFRTKIYPDFKVAMIHSRLNDDEKIQVMRDFSKGAIQVLVSTSVVEVGVDVPRATAMVIEHAERFGLSQLHQLRGRVGRSDLQSYCFLIYAARLTEQGIQRLKVMKETTDGFKIAEEDLKIRGPGELLGLKQAGGLRFRIADLMADFSLFTRAREDIQALLSDDPGLLKPANRVVQE